jgi:transposase-like protein
MTQVHFTLSQDKVQSLIERSVSDEFIKELLTTTFNQLMEAQRDQYINAGSYERTSDRTDYRNGYYERDYTVRVGTLTLKVPRTRDGKFSTDVFERYQRCEKALLATLLEMYVSGVSTRKVSKIVEQMCGTSVSKSFVSSLTKDLDEVVGRWQNRDLSDVSYPFLMVDVMFIKVREDHRVLSKSCHIAVGITGDGRREVLGHMIGSGEREDTWQEFFDQLKSRGLSGVDLVISDAHAGLVSAARKTFVGSSWQRCQVHFLRNILAPAPRKNSEEFREAVKGIFKLTTMKAAREAKNAVVDEYAGQSKYAKACEILDEGFDDAFQYIALERTHNRLKSTNLLERLNQEVRRREKVVRIFPNVASANRLIGAVLMNSNEDWIGSTRRYIRFEDE